MVADIFDNSNGSNMNGNGQADEDSIETLRRYMRLFWHGTWVIALAAVLGGGLPWN